MSLLNEYNKKIRESLGLTELAPLVPPVASPTDPEIDLNVGLDLSDEALAAMPPEKLKELLDKVNDKLGKLSEESPITDPAIAQTELESAAPVDPLVAAPIATAAPVDSMLEDDVYFEMLNHLRSQVASCTDDKRKNAYKKMYEMWHKQRDKIMKEMAVEAPVV